MAHEVFISHSSKDKPMADAICAGLEARGIRCWIAPRDVLPGMEWTKAIVDAISTCKVFLLILTDNSNRSSQAIKEVDCAVNHEKTIIPFRMEDIKPTGSMEYYLGSLHWLDALTTPIEKHIGELADYIRRILEVSLPKPDRSSVGEPVLINKKEEFKSSTATILKQPSAGKLRKQNKWLWLAGFVVVAAGIITSVILSGNKPAAQLTSTESAPAVMSPLTNTFTPLPLTEEPSQVIVFTPTPGIITAVMLKNSYCRETTDEDTTVVSILYSGDSITILGINGSNDWVNVENTNGKHFCADQYTEVTNCWVHLQEGNIDVNLQDIPVEIFTPRPAPKIFYNGILTVVYKDGSTSKDGTNRYDERSDAVTQAEAMCKQKTNEGSVSCTYEIGSGCSW